MVRLVHVATVGGKERKMAVKKGIMAAERNSSLLQLRGEASSWKAFRGSVWPALPPLHPHLVQGLKG